MVDSVDLGSLGAEETEEEERAAFEEIEEQRLEIPPELEFIRDIPMRISVELGRSNILVKDLLRLYLNQIFEVDKMVGEPLEIHINEQLVARGEVVVINDRFGIRLTDIINPLEQGLQA
ncbi:flagellar motor switch protein FliN [Nitrospinota bacterium]